jgi:hypothetical protein
MTTVIAVAALVLAIAALVQHWVIWNVTGLPRVLKYWDRIPRFGPAGLRGWIRAQWHRVRPPKLDYRMVPAGERVVSKMYGAQESTDGQWHPWGPPACQPEKVTDWARSVDGANAEFSLKDLPDYSDLTDDELAEKVKTAKLGDGLLAEAGLRAHRRYGYTP